jgi:hypothetical protein
VPEFVEENSVSECLNCNDGEDRYEKRDDRFSRKRLYQLTTGTIDKFFNIMFWNCHGISNLFTIDSEQKKLIQNFKVVALCETWADRRILSIDSISSNFNFIQKEAVRISNRGRAIGGLLMLIHKSLQYSVIEMNDTFLFVRLKNSNLNVIVGLVYLRSGYEIGGIELLKQFFDRNIDILNASPVFIGGDFNARIGHLNSPLDESLFRVSLLSNNRCSLDDAVDKKGKQLVNTMENNLFCVINGRINGDIPGQLTFFCENGSSTIDHVWINVMAVNTINKFIISDFILNSDHLPLLLETNLCTDRVARIENVIFKQNLIWIDSRKEQFRNLMEQSLRLQEFEGLSIEQNFNNLITAIMEVAQSLDMIKKIGDKIIFRNKPWYDLECNAKKRDVRRLYRLAKQHRFQGESLTDYLTEKKLYKTMLVSKKLNYYDTLRSNLVNVKNSQQFWKAVKVFRGRAGGENNVPMETWVSFLKKKYESCEGEKVYFLDALHPYLDKKFELVELDWVISNLKAKKAPGCDGVQYEFYKALPHQWKLYMLNLFNKLLESEMFPLEWSKIKMFFLYKKGDRSDPKNYRGIALINNIVKMFTRLLEVRLTTWVNSCGILPECQSGFRRERGCTDNIFVLHSLVFHQVLVKRRKLFGLFVDFESAFDSVPHSLLWNELGEAGVSSKLIRLLDGLYSAASVIVDKGNETSDPIRISKGVLQGDSISPLLFSLYIRNIEHHFRSKGLHGIPIDNYSDIMILLFADDIVLMADSESDLKNKLNCLSEYCTKLKLTVNIEKTKIVPFHKKGLKRNMYFYYGDKKIEVVRKYKYLGIDFYSSGKFAKFGESVVCKAKRVGESIIGVLKRAKSNEWGSKIKLYDALLVPVILYGSEAWALGCCDIVEKAQLYFFKRLLLLNQNTPSWSLRLEVGRVKLVNIVFQRSINFLIKILKMPNDRYPKVCYNRLLQLATEDHIRYDRQLNWVSLLKQQFQFTGVDINWEDDVYLLYWLECNRKYLIERHAEMLRDADIQLAYNSMSCSLYRKLNPIFTQGEQLPNQIPFRKIRCITQLRLATRYSLYVFADGEGVWIDCSKDCPICNLHEQETLEHFLLTCPMYNNIRSSYIAEYTYNIVSNNDKLMVLLSNFDTLKVNRIYLYTAKAIKIRSLICEVG